MGIHVTLRKLVTVGILTLGAAGLALADHGSSGEGKSSSSSTTEIRFKTRLAGPNINGITPSGEAEFRSIPGQRSSLKVEAEHVSLPAATVLTVVLQSGANPSVNVGTLKLNAFGEGELDLETQNGQTVPVVQKGDTVSITDGATTTYLIGVF